MKYTVYKRLVLKVEVEAETPQDAWDAQLEDNDNTFEVIECDYDVFDDEGCDVTSEVEMK